MMQFRYEFLNLTSIMLCISTNSIKITLLLFHKYNFVTGIQNIQVQTMYLALHTAKKKKKHIENQTKIIIGILLYTNLK